MPIELPVLSDNVPENLECIVSNTRWQELVSLLSVSVTDGFRWNVGNTTPIPADRIWPWLHLESDNKPDRVYYYAGGAWLSKHTMAPGIVMMWEGAEADIDAFDGGEAGAINADKTTGPFWERVTEMNGRIPIGPGEIHAGPPAVNITENENKGEYEKQLADENYQRHRHFGTARATVVAPAGTPSGSQQLADDVGGIGNENYTLQGTSTAAAGGRTSFVAGASQTDANVAFPLLPKVRGIWFIRRTDRLYYRLPA